MYGADCIRKLTIHLKEERIGARSMNSERLVMINIVILLERTIRIGPISRIVR
jgi:hypothetical protein